MVCESCRTPSAFESGGVEDVPHWKKNNKRMNLRRCIENKMKKNGKIHVKRNVRIMTITTRGIEEGKNNAETMKNNKKE